MRAAGALDRGTGDYYGQGMERYRQCARRIIELTECQGFSAAEDYIEAMALADHQRDALWLLAWAHAPRSEQLIVASLASVGF